MQFVESAHRADAGPGGHLRAQRREVDVVAFRVAFQDKDGLDSENFPLDPRTVTGLARRCVRDTATDSSVSRISSNRVFMSGGA